jgi:phosphoglycerol geranylgeranyltransferase
MTTILKDIQVASLNGEKLLAILIDPDKFILKDLDAFVDKAHKTIATHFFIGGSTVEVNVTQKLIIALKNITHLPIVLFPGDVTQISDHADAILFLSLLSGNNPDYLISKHVQSVPLLEKTSLEIIPTGYILIESGTKTAVQRVTNTKPIHDKILIAQTAKAGEYLGMQLIYLEAGSGAKEPVSESIITQTKKKLTIPLIVGGGIRTKSQLNLAYQAGADLVVIGTAFEKDLDFFNEITY